MLAIALTMLFSKSYSQNNIQVKVINGDTLFVFNKEYANYIVSKYDSLKHYKISFNVCADNWENDKKEIKTTIKYFMLNKLIIKQI